MCEWGNFLSLDSILSHVSPFVRNLGNPDHREWLPSVHSKVDFPYKLSADFSLKDERTKRHLVMTR